VLPGHEFLVDTVHKFQGDERDLMIFSPVVSDGISPGAISFLKNNGNLFNVAITRARAQLVVVGDRAAATDSSVDYLSRFAAYALQLDQNASEAVVRELTDLGAQYPTVSSPERVSEWERILYRAMYAAGVRSLPQHPVENYLLDFALFAGDRKLNIEVDGERYHRNWDGELCRRDQIRNQRMIELGWDVMRFWVYEVRDDMDGCIRRVKEWDSRGTVVS
jgi:very-short-patch-repair endonuclease